MNPEAAFRLEVTMDPTRISSPDLDEQAMKAWSFDYSPYPKAITNLQHEILTVNKAFLDTFEFTEEEVKGKHPGVLLRNRTLGPELEMQIPQSLKLSGEWRGEVYHTSKSGIERPFLLYLTTIFSPSGEPLAYLGTDLDLSERKALEDQVFQGEKLSNIGENLATLMHEIRNPLAGISINAYMLAAIAEQGKTLESDDLESIRLISKEARRLDSLVRDILSYSRKSELHSERVNLKEFFDELKELILFQAKKHSVEIQIKPFDETISFFIDVDGMKQVFLNLIQNAIEAAAESPEQVVRLGMRIAEDPKWKYISASSRVLLLNVDNSGKRISDENLANLFKPFFTSKSEGIGLGLATAAKIVRQHHGILSHYHIGIDSSYKIDEGPFTTRFTVVLPI